MKMRRQGLIALLLGGIVFTVLTGCSGGNPDLNKAEDAMERQNFEQALASVDSALAKDSANVQAYRMQAQVLRQMADSTMHPDEYKDLYRRARAAEQKAIEFNPGSRSDIEGRQTFIYTRQYQRGAQEFRKAQRTTDSSGYRRAAAYFGGAAATLPDSADAILNEAYARLNMQRLKQDGSMQNTIPVLESYIEKKDKPSKDAYEILSALYLQGGEPQKTIDLLEKARKDLAARSTHFKVTGSPGLKYSGTVEAGGSSRSVSGGVPDKIRIDGGGQVSGQFQKQQKKGQLRVQLVYQGTPVADTTIKTGTASLATNLDDEAPLAQLEGRLLNAYNKAGETEKAMAEYRQQIEDNPDNVTYRYNYGSLLLNAERYDEAVEQLEKAVEIDPRNVEAQYNLGAAYTNQARNIQKRIRAIDDSLQTVRDAAMENNRQPTKEERETVNALDQERKELVKKQRELYNESIAPLERARQMADQGSTLQTDACRVLVTAYVQTERMDKAKELEQCANMEGEIQTQEGGN